MQEGLKINYISNLIIPIIVVFIILYGYVKKIDIYDSFIDGVKESFSMIKNLFPTFLAMILAVNIFTESGFLDFILNILEPLFNFLKVPSAIVPLALIRPISSSASLAYLNKIFASYGPDSFIGTLGSVIQGCTDTTFYIISLYFGSIGIKKIKYSLKVCLLADLIGIIASILIVKYFFH